MALQRKPSVPAACIIDWPTLTLPSDIRIHQHSFIDVSEGFFCLISLPTRCFHTLLLQLHVVVYSTMTTHFTLILYSYMTHCEQEPVVSVYRRAICIYNEMVTEPTCTLYHTFTSSLSLKYFTSRPHSMMTPDTSLPRMRGNSLPDCLIFRGSLFMDHVAEP